MAKELARACASEANLMKTWSVVETKRLLICVKKYKHLYDPNDNLFGNDDAEREAFQNISKVFDRSGKYSLLLLRNWPFETNLLQISNAWPAGMISRRELPKILRKEWNTT